MRGSREDSAAPVETSDCILDVVGLSVRYGGRTALEGVTFALPCGTQLAVVGPNGAGKSTLLKAVAGLLEPSAGRLTVHGHEPGVGVCVAYVQQRSAIDWNFPVTVADVVMMGRAGNIGLFRRPGARDRQVVADALASVGLQRLADQPIGSLSGGQQQRMFIARALAQEAELVLMDEPMAGLDPRSRDDILAVLDHLREEDVGVAVATHDLELAAGAFDRVLLLNRRMVGFGAPDAVLTEDRLVETYGGRVRFAASGAEVIVGDAECDGRPHD